MVDNLVEELDVAISCSRGALAIAAKEGATDILESITTAISELEMAKATYIYDTLEDADEETERYEGDGSDRD